ncbi:MAG: KEOPS complex kinase/ATPase Bud32 [Nanoarchaeota archaeon]
MKPKILQIGAEAIISLKDNQIIKNRTKKSYRLPIIDEKLRSSRTRHESKIIEKLRKIIPIPKIIKIDENNKTIVMEFIDGEKISEHLENLNWKKICKQIASVITKIHNNNIIHGDLTTSNMIYKNNKIYLIDFGLGFHSHKIEAKAVDLHLLKQALEAKHFLIAEQAIKIILDSYKSNNGNLILEQLKRVESRGRYKDKY